MIYHLAEPRLWEQALIEGFYRAESLVTEGFIHLSTSEQVVATFGRYYSTRRDLILLSVDEDAVGVADRLLWETATAGQRFPHLYGPLPVEAVVFSELDWVPKG
jgi:uncharacterized protein (DUF952 family)